MKNYRLTRTLNIAGRLTILWSVIWMLISLFLTEEKLARINMIHPWMIWVGLLLISAILHLIIRKIRPDVEVKTVSINKIRKQVQILMIVLLCAVTWSEGFEKHFKWTIEVASLILFELLYIQLDKSKGISNKKDLALTSILAAICCAFSAALNFFIEPIGKVVLFVGLKLKEVIGAICVAVSKAIVFLVHLLPKAKSMDVEQVQDIEINAADGVEQITSQGGSYQVMKFVFYGLMIIMIAMALVAIVYFVVLKIKSLFVKKNENQVRLEASSKKDVLKAFLEKIRRRFNRAKAFIALYSHKDSVGWALYSIEKQYRRKRKLRRKNNETPAAYIERIIEFEKNEQCDDTLIDKLELIKEKATICAYSRNHNWLEKL